MKRRPLQSNKIEFSAGPYHAQLNKPFGPKSFTKVKEGGLPRPLQSGLRLEGNTSMVCPCGNRKSRASHFGVDPRALALYAQAHLWKDMLFPDTPGKQFSALR